MSRKKLITHAKSNCFVWPAYMQQLFEPHFQLCRFDGTMDPDSIYVIDVVELIDKQDTSVLQWAQQLAESGHKLLINNLWEHVNTNYAWGHYLTNTNWFWYNESLWYAELVYL